MVLMNLFADRDSGGENRLMGTLEAGAEGSEWRAGTRLHGPRVSGDLPRASGPGTGTLHQPKWPGKSGRWGRSRGGSTGKVPANTYCQFMLTHGRNETKIVKQLFFS